MKTGPFTPLPGDLFTWHYDSDDTRCYPTEHAWSSIMKCYVPCNGTNLLISLTKTDISWLNEGRFIHVHVDDLTIDDVQWRLRDALHPRK